MSQNPGAIPASGDVSTEAKQDTIITELQAVTDLLGGPAILSFTNPTFGNDLSKANAGFSGTPELIHDGTDSTGWAATNLTGANFTFNSTTHAKQGIATVDDFSLLSGESVTINGTNITNTTLTEGVEWTAATSNTATATSLASALNGVEGITATSSAAVVTVSADNTLVQADITIFTSTDATNLPVSAQSIDGTAAVNGDEALFTAPVVLTFDLDFANFTTVTLNTFVVDWSTQGGTKEIELRFRLAGTNVGNSVNLSEFLNIGTFSTWQSSSIAKTAFGIDTDTVDEFVIKVVDIGTGTPPSAFFDLIQIQESGTPVDYTLTIPPGFKFIAEQINVSVRVAANGVTSRDNLPGDRYFNLPALAVGEGSKSTINGITSTEQTVRTMNEQLLISESIIETVSTNVAQTELIIHYTTNIPPSLVLKSSTDDTIFQIVNDDFTPFIFFRVNASGVLIPE